jgi:hypothetical protein
MYMQTGSTNRRASYPSSSRRHQKATKPGLTENTCNPSRTYAPSLLRSNSRASWNPERAGRAPLASYQGRFESHFFVTRSPEPPKRRPGNIERSALHFTSHSRAHRTRPMVIPNRSTRRSPAPASPPPPVLGRIGQLIFPTQRPPSPNHSAQFKSRLKADSPFGPMIKPRPSARLELTHPFRAKHVDGGRTCPVPSAHPDPGLVRRGTCCQADSMPACLPHRPNRRIPEPFPRPQTHQVSLRRGRTVRTDIGSQLDQPPREVRQTPHPMPGWPPGLGTAGGP